MFIDPYSPDWLEQLATRAARVGDGVHLHLLIDGAFIPKLYRTVREALIEGESLFLLFEMLPACSNATRAVSPFLITYRSVSPQLMQALAQCNGWPMLSAIETTESLATMSARLGAWCIIHNEQQRFNFRFPDTRQLPTMFAALTETQRGQLVGPAISWTFIARDGRWHALPLPVASQPPAEQAELDNDQFAKILSDSEADEILLAFKYRDGAPSGLHSIHHAIVSAALGIARRRQLPEHLVVPWCDACMQARLLIPEGKGPALLAAWLSEQSPESSGARQ